MKKFSYTCLRKLKQMMKMCLVIEAYGQTIDFITDNETEVKILNQLFHPFFHIKSIDLNASLYSSSKKWRIFSAEYPYKEFMKYITREELKEQELYFSEDHKGETAYDSVNNFYILKEFNGRKSLTIVLKDKQEIFWLRENSKIDVTHLEHLTKHLIGLLWRLNGIFRVHASGFLYNGKGYLLAGEKECGKSTLLMHALSNGAKYIGNDVIYLSMSEQSNSVIMIGYPHIIRLGALTVRDIDQLYSYFYINRKTENTPEIYQFRWAGDNKIEFYHPLLNQIFEGCVSVAVSKLDCIILPRFEASLTGNFVYRANFNDNKDLLFQAFTSDRWIGDWLNILKKEELMKVDREGFKKLEHRFDKYYEFRFGPSVTSPFISLFEKI